MTNSTPSTSRTIQRVLAVLAAGCALSLAVVQAPALRAEPVAAAKKALPLSHTFEKVKDAEHGPYVLTLKNNSKETLKVSAQVLLSVAFHATDKARNVPAQEIAAGATCTIADLATDDKVNVSAAGYETLQIVVPGKAK